MAALLLRFFADPEGGITLPIREVVEMARNARDFEVFLASAPAAHSQRLGQALNLVDAVLAGGTDIGARRPDLEHARLILDSVRAHLWDLEEQATLEVLGRKPPEAAPTPNPELVVGILERSAVPRSVLLERQRAQAKTREESEEDDPDQAAQEVPG